MMPNKLDQLFKFEVHDLYDEKIEAFMKKEFHDQMDRELKEFDSLPDDKKLKIWREFWDNRHFKIDSFYLK